MTVDTEEYIIEVKYLETLLMHIQLVQNNCLVLAKKLMENGKTKLGRTLIQNSLKHDNSKFVGMEWEFMALRDQKRKLNKAEQALLDRTIEQHCCTNEHHPEYWGTIHDMPEIYIIEMVCDWKARAQEFGTDVRKWITDEALKRFVFKTRDPTYEVIMKYVDMLCGPPLGTLKTTEKIKTEKGK
jgi:hypothetical protein